MHLRSGQMEVIDAIKLRRSVRAYTPDPIPDEILKQILEAGRMAPSANNQQPWHFIIVKDAQKRIIMSEEKYAKFLRESPVVIVGCGDREDSPDWYPIDVSIAMENMVLAATAEGLGTCWVGSFDEKRIRELLRIPERYKIISLLAVGYPRKKLDLSAAFVRSKSRKDPDKIFSYEQFGGK